jgi:hypothetical protein
MRVLPDSPELHGQKGGAPRIRRGLELEGFARATNCPPWTIQELVVHIASSITVGQRPPTAPLGAAPREAADYYRRPERGTAVYRQANIDHTREQTRAVLARMTAPAPRDPEQRKRDTISRLEQDVDAWFATVGAGGVAYLVPLSFVWDGARLVVATPEASPTGRNLRESGRVRVGLGLTRDVVLIDGTVESFSRQTVPQEVAEEFAAKRWDARRESTPYGYFRITPQRIQAWREENELAGRTLMRDGRWLV